MPRNSGGTYTLPVSNPVVTGTSVSSTWANDTMNDLKAEMTDSLSRSGKGGMSAALGIIDGAVATPGISFNSEAGSGLYRVGAGDVRFALLGTDLLKFAAASLELLGKLQISAAEPILNLYESDADSGERAWRIVIAAEKFYIQALNDAFSSGTSPLTIERSGSTASKVILKATNLELDGAVLSLSTHTIQSSFPVVQLLDTDLTETTGKRWYIGAANDSFFAYRNTAAGGDFSTYDTILVANTVAFNYMGNTVWHSGNDGPSSGLNADLLDGNEASAFLAASNFEQGTFTVYLRSSNNGADLDSGSAYYTKIGKLVCLRLPELVTTNTTTTLVVDGIPAGLQYLVAASAGSYHVLHGYDNGVSGVMVTLVTLYGQDYFQLKVSQGYSNFNAAAANKGIAETTITYMCDDV